VRDTGADPFSGALYVFRAKRADRIKIVWLDGTGLCLYAKRLQDEQYAFVFDEIETGGAEIEAGLDKVRGQSGTARTARPGKGFAPISNGSRWCLSPTTRPAAKVWRTSGSVRTRASASTLYRQEAIYARDGVELDRSLMAQWMGKLGFELAPLADHVLARIKQGERIFGDETTLPTLAPGTGRVKQAWLWTYARDDRTFGGSGPPMVAYRFEDSRGGACVARHLEGYRGILQVDGYAAYKRLGKPEGTNEGATLAGCWAHVRRKFFELQASESSPLATRTVEAMRPPWAIEDIRGRTAQTRADIRRQHSAPIVADLFALWEKELPRLSGKSKLAEAIRYARSRRDVLERFLDDGRIEIDSNIVERAIRPHTITRKNALFAGSDGGGRTWGHHGDAPDHRQDERGRSLRLADPEAPAPRRRIAQQPDRRSHARELRRLNGLGFELSKNLHGAGQNEHWFQLARSCLSCMIVVGPTRSLVHNPGSFRGSRGRHRTQARGLARAGQIRPSALPGPLAVTG
jgi:hypothetical protein